MILGNFANDGAGTASGPGTRKGCHYILPDGEGPGTRKGCHYSSPGFHGNRGDLRIWTATGGGATLRKSPWGEYAHGDAGRPTDFSEGADVKQSEHPSGMAVLERVQNDRFSNISHCSREERVPGFP